MSGPDFLNFGAWGLRIARRELRLRGEVQDVEPKVFDLLVLLIEQRLRVVPRAELLDRVWGGTVVSETVIARTVMKARKAIGDKADDTSLIRTVHRVGYQFVGEPLAPQEAAAEAPDTLLRLGLLPFENVTGEARLTWLEQGLTALVAQALNADARLSVAPPEAVAKALASAAVNPMLEAPARTIERLLGLHCVIHARIRRHGENHAGYRIDYRASGPRSQNVHGHLDGDEPTALSLALARQIEAQLFPNAEAVVGFQSTDAYANQSFARALQALAEERWQSAGKLLQVVLDIEPGSTVAAHHHLWVLTELHDPAAFALGETLLQRALAAGDSRLAAMVHHALGQAHLHLDGPSAAQHHMDEALRLARPHGVADWVLRIYTTQALHELTRRNYPRARELLEHAARSSEATNNRIELARIMTDRGVIEALSGNLVSARQWMEDALQLSTELLLDTSIVRSAANLAGANADLGFIGRAITLCDALVGRIGALQESRTAAVITVTVCGIYADHWLVLPMDRAIEALRQRPDGLSPTTAPYLAMAAGFRAAAAGDLEAACTAMAEAIGLIRERGYHMMAEQLMPFRLQAELSAGHFGVARAVIDELRALPSFEDEDRLQGLVLRADAVELHARGDMAAARAAMLAATRLLPAGRWNACARIDAAWLHLEDGDTAKARQLLRDIRPWLDEHPAGWLVQARFKAASCQWAEALEAQQRFLNTAPRPLVTEALRTMARVYAEAAAGRPVAIPAAPQLPGLC